MRVIVDTGVVVAAADESESVHEAAIKVLGEARFVYLFPLAVIIESAHFIRVKLGSMSEAKFLRGVPEMIVESPHSQDWPRIAELVERYRDFPLGMVDASIVALAERLKIKTILTLDTRHFRAIKPKHVESFTILPEL